jgi:hypothetical protein
LTLVVGGIVRNFTLDSHGSSPRGASTLSLKVPKLQLTGKLAVKMAGDFRDPMAAVGLTNSSLSKVSRTVRVFILVDNTFYESKKLLSYTSKAGKSGSAKQANPLQFP